MEYCCETNSRKVDLSIYDETSSELAANFIDSLDEHNITKHKQEYTKAMLRCYNASKELGTLIARIQHNITEVNHDTDSRQSF